MWKSLCDLSLKKKTPSVVRPKGLSVLARQVRLAKQEPDDAAKTGGHGEPEGPEGPRMLVHEDRERSSGCFAGQNLGGEFVFRHGDGRGVRVGFHSNPLYHIYNKSQVTKSLFKHSCDAITCVQRLSPLSKTRAGVS